MAAGVSQDQIVLDPGFGFGKILNENFPLLAGLETLHSIGFPILVGVSRKGFLRRAVADTAHGQPTTIPPPDSHLPTSAANTAAILAGAHILRVHDVEPAREVAAIADRILAAAESIPTTRP
jgi:dihydropteroate synthase